MNEEWSAIQGGRHAGRHAARPRPRAARVFMSEEIFADAREVIIVHGEGEYRLRATRNGKLILTK